MTEKCVKDKVEILSGKTIKKISIYRNGNNPKYYYYFRHNGVKYQGSCLSDDLETSKINVREIFYDLTKGLRQRGRKKRIKLEDVVKDFLKHKKNQGKSPKTIKEYERQSKYILEWYNTHSKGSNINVFFSRDRYKEYCEWRTKYYDDDKHERFQIYYRKRETIQGRPLGNVGNTSLNRECLLMGSILRHGKMFMGILKDIPIPSYEVKKEPSQINEKVILDDVDEYYKVKEYWMEKDPFIWDCFGTIFHCGLRPGELGKITYSDVHLKEGYVLIRNRKSKGDVINTPVPLVQSSREIFERLMSREDVKKGKDDLVFVREGKEKPYSSVYLNKLFKKSVQMKTGKDMTLHSLRHLFITMSQYCPVKVS
jgi:integrase